MIRGKIQKFLLAVSVMAVLVVLAAPADAQGFFRRGGGHRWQQQQQDNSGPGAAQDQGGQSGPGDGSFRQRKEALKQQLMQLPPDQRRQRIQELKEQFKQRFSERKQKFDEKWNNASPEQKSKFCGKISERCTGDQADSPGCQLAQERCAGK